MLFVVCERCHRHVKQHEAACPFCGQASSGVLDARTRALLALLAGAGLTLAACSGNSESIYGAPGYPNTGGSAASDGSSSFACPVCSNPSFVCASPGAESVNFQVGYQTSTGCSGHLIQAGGSTKSYTLTCNPPELCSDQGCSAATLTDASFAWSTVTCIATTK